MPNLVTLRPGARGTIRLTQQYGDKLICVRYRYNSDTLIRLKTIELIIDEKKWIPRNELQSYELQNVEYKTAEL